jgi:hypothetical protein
LLDTVKGRGRRQDVLEEALPEINEKEIVFYQNPVYESPIKKFVLKKE